MKVKKLLLQKQFVVIAQFFISEKGEAPVLEEKCFSDRISLKGQHSTQLAEPH